MDKDRMRIVLIGCDKIGNAILEQFMEEGDHSICVVDIDGTRVKRAFDKYEITGVVGNGASYEVQRKANVDKADLVIAGTNSDEVNILCCMVAKDLGAQHTVIINNNEKYSDQIENLRERLNINLSVSPEKEAAAEVARMLRFPSALQVELFADGKMEMIDVILSDDSEFVGHTIAAKHGRLYPDVQICAVERDGEIIIPSGTLVLEAGDRLSIASTVTGIIRYLKGTGLYQSRIKRVMILGGGVSSYYLARRILSAGMDVTIIEGDLERCRYLSEQLPKATIIKGGDNDYELMRNEGLITSDAFVSFTTNNEKNIIASLYAINKNVAKVITAIDENNLFSVVGEIELGSVVSPNVLTATRIMHFVKGLQSAKELGSKLNAIYTLGDSDAYVLEFIINDKFSKPNVPLKELTLKPNTLIAMIIRNNRTIIPRGNDVIIEGDYVIVVTKEKGVDGINEVIE